MLLDRRSQVDEHGPAELAGIGRAGSAAPLTCSIPVA